MSFYLLTLCLLCSESIHNMLIFLPGVLSADLTLFLSFHHKDTTSPQDVKAIFSHCLTKFMTFPPKKKTYSLGGDTAQGQRLF